VKRIILILCSLSAGTALSAHYNYGLGLSGSLLSESIDPDEGEASTRNGSAFGLFLSGRAGFTPSQRLDVDLGFSHLFLKGEKENQNQNAKVMGPFASLSYQYVIEDWSVGALAYLRSGPGMTLEYESRDQNKTAVGLGFEVNYKIIPDSPHMEVGVHYLHFPTIKDHTINEAMLSVNFWLGDTTKQVSAPVEPTEAEPTPLAEVEPQPVEPEPEPVKEVNIELSSSILQFKTSSDEFTEASKPKTSSLAAALNKAKGVWKHVKIGGHSDASGSADFNQKLSHRRANKVRDMFVEAGIAASSVEATGYGSTRLLEGFAPNAAEHRRVELSFSGVTDAEELRRLINQAVGTKEGAE
jgi:outer membrane protein OmpA-like peptidoglycan-associated protein